MKKRLILYTILFIIMIILSFYLRNIHNLLFILGMFISAIIILKIFMIVEKENNYIYKQEDTNINFNVSIAELKEKIDVYFKRKKYSAKSKDDITCYTKGVFQGHKIIEHVLVIDEIETKQIQSLIKKNLDVINKTNEKLINDHHLHTRHQLLAFIFLNSKDIENIELNCEDTYTITKRYGGQETYGMFIPVFIDKTNKIISIKGIELKKNAAKLMYYNQQGIRILKTIEKILKKPRL